MITQKMYKMKIADDQSQGHSGKEPEDWAIQGRPYERETPELNIKEQYRRQNNAPQKSPRSEAWDSDYTDFTARGHLVADRIKVSNEPT